MDKHQIELMCFDLTLAAYCMHKAYKKLRESLSRIAGCSLDDWSYEDLENYLKVALAWYENGRVRV